MSLNNQRNYVCFVCGKIYYVFEEFQEHIKKEHEEGRHYLICPLMRCRIACRCLKSHFKHAHPHDPVPKLAAMRAIEWKDPRQPKQKKKVPVFKEGFFTSAKNGNQKMHFRSGYELEVYKCIENISEIASYEVEPISVEYTLNGKFKRYYPDLRIKFTDGRVQIWEIKPANQSNWKINEVKWDAAKRYCANRGWEFSVITEAVIKDLQKKSKVSRQPPIDP